MIAVLSASAVAMVGAMPVFLVGALAVLIRADLGFNEARLGLAASMYWTTSALFAIPIGHLVERLGTRYVMRGAVTVGVVSLSGIALSGSYLMLLAFLLIAGMGHNFCQLGANLLLADGVPRQRQGLAFGLKQSANPMAALAGGVAVPVLALTLGWRWVFVAAAVGALLLGLLHAVPRRTSTPRAVVSERTGAVARRPLVVLGAAAGFGAGSAMALVTFMTEYAVSIGISAGRAGGVLAVGSAVAIVVRIGSGWRADRRDGGNLLVVASMLALGGVALALFPFIDSFGTMVLLTLVAYAFGWGWAGLFNATIVVRNPQAPAVATGITQVGGALGGVVGPVAFGLIVTTSGYPLAWWATAGSLILASALTLIGRAMAKELWVLPPTSRSAT